MQIYSLKMMLLNCRASIICAEFQVWLPTTAPRVVASSTQPLPAGGGVAVLGLQTCKLLQSDQIAQPRPITLRGGTAVSNLRPVWQRGVELSQNLREISQCLLLFESAYCQWVDLCLLIMIFADKCLFRI